MSKEIRLLIPVSVSGKMEDQFINKLLNER